MTDDLRERLTIPTERLDALNSLLLRPNLRAIDDFMRVLEKYGTPEDINRRARDAGTLSSQLDRVRRVNPDHLAEAAQPVNVLLIADVDFLADRLWAQVQSFFGQRIATPFAGNGDEVANALENLSGSGAHVRTACRSASRPAPGCPGFDSVG